MRMVVAITINKTDSTRKTRLNSQAYTCSQLGKALPSDRRLRPRLCLINSRPSGCADRRCSLMLWIPATTTEKRASMRPLYSIDLTVHGLEFPFGRTSGQELVELRQLARRAPCESQQGERGNYWSQRTYKGSNKL